MKRIIPLILIIALFFTLAPGASAASYYSDTAGHWAESAIWKWSRLKVLEGDGDGKFRPDDTVNQSEMAAIMCRLMGYTEEEPTVYDGLPDNKWYTTYLRRAASAGVMPDLWSCGTVSEGVQRQEAVYIIATALDVAGSGTVEFTDSSDIAPWALESVKAMVEKGYIDGYPDGSFRPNGTLTRAEAVTIIDNILGGNYITYGSFVLEKLDIPAYSYDNSLFTYDEMSWKSYSGTEDAAVGIDVSAYQYDIDWQAVAESGIDFAMIRVGFRGWGSSGSLNVDKYAMQNLRGAADAGLDVGVYFFSQAISTEEALEEAELVLSIIKDYDITYPVVFDWEEIGNSYARTNGMKTDLLTDCAITFCDRIAEAGYTPMVYYYKYLGLVKYDLTRLQDYDIWFAQYADVPNYPYDFQMWQYTSEGTVPGIVNDTDMNICFKKYAD